MIMAKTEGDTTLKKEKGSPIAKSVTMKIRRQRKRMGMAAMAAAGRKTIPDRMSRKPPAVTTPNTGSTNMFARTDTGETRLK